MQTAAQTKEDHGQENAKAWLGSIEEMLRQSKRQSKSFTKASYLSWSATAGMLLAHHQKTAPKNMKSYSLLADRRCAFGASSANTANPIAQNYSTETGARHGRATPRQRLHYLPSRNASTLANNTCTVMHNKRETVI